MGFIPPFHYTKIIYLVTFEAYRKIVKSTRCANRRERAGSCDRVCLPLSTRLVLLPDRKMTRESKFRVFGVQNQKLALVEPRQERRSQVLSQMGACGWRADLGELSVST